MNYFCHFNTRPQNNIILTSNRTSRSYFYASSARYFWLNILCVNGGWFIDPTFVASFSSTDPILVVLIDTSLVSCNFTFSGLLIPAPTLAAEKETPIRTCLQKKFGFSKRMYLMKMFMPTSCEILFWLSAISFPQKRDLSSTLQFSKFPEKNSSIKTLVLKKFNILKDGQKNYKYLGIKSYDISL